MQDKTFDRLVAFALFFMAHWFFGNLYEEIVLAPNQLTDSYEALKGWQNYFKITNQIYYYVPFTQLAVVATTVLYFKSTGEKQKNLLKKAVITGWIAIFLTILIVTQLNLKLFFGDLEKYQHKLFTLSVIWLIGNAIRLYFVGASLFYVLKTYSLRQSLYADKTKYSD
ncbi:DUF1772 domain-containing protein [Larkinella knui]|uniref:Uncharacterized protein n=1 Tax=Larkinella knui TaxID=2025310 RepID=A0A3P1CUJ1_9BACT|nr:hypothetical protein [Larkinella knui]RRB16997.1 hypothetical protein EHT87_01555 [Larkinella knui]